MAKMICVLCLLLTAVTVSVCQDVCPTVAAGTAGDCSEMCTSDADCATGQLCCSNGCGHVCKVACSSSVCPALCRLTKDANGCDVCDCNDLCPVLDCLPSCSNIRRGEDGCNECYCDYPCPKIGCAPWCDTKKDDKGCVVCDCPEPCPTVDCLGDCTVKKDENGCDVCDCAVEPPPFPADKRCTTKPDLKSCSYWYRYRYIYDIDRGMCRRVQGRSCSYSLNKFSTLWECQEACQAPGLPEIINPPSSGRRGQGRMDFARGRFGWRG